MNGMLKLFVCTTIAFACSRETCSYNSDLIKGKWQSLNDRNIVIEYGQDGSYVLYRNKEELDLGSVSGVSGKNCYNARKLTCNRYKVKVFKCSDNELLSNSEVEFLSDNRIRIYMYKHHNILDVADEFARTNDLESFDAIMNDILAAPTEE